MRVTVTGDAAVDDLLAIDALGATHVDGRCVLQTRSYVVRWHALNYTLGLVGFSWCNRAWSKAMDVDEWRRLESVVGSRSLERRARERDEAAAAKRVATLDERIAKRQRVFELCAAGDPTYARRNYQYSQLLLSMSKSGRFTCGKSGDVRGVPNWPAPPVPRESSIVSRDTQSLAHYP